jgi:glutamyl aminopeptidase
VSSVCRWNDLWLNEGFASYVEWRGIREYVRQKPGAPDWDVDGQQVYDAQTPALALDSSQYSHPIVQDVSDPSEIDSLFDSISYSKGSSLLLMLDLGVLTQLPFQAGVHAYLVQHAYGNAASADLWNALQAAAPANLGMTIPSFMQRWTTQMGYPVVQMLFSEDGKSLVLTQQRFLELPKERQDPDLVDSQAGYKWDIQLSLQNRATAGTKKQWFLAGEDQVTIPFDAAADGFLAINAGRAGYFRTNFPSSMWTSIASYLVSEDEGVFSNADRIGMIDDVWTLALAGQTTYANAFAMLQFLALDYDEYTPWASAFSQLGRVARLLYSKPDTAAIFNNFVTGRWLINNNTISQPPWLGQGPNAHLPNLLQASFVSVLVAYNHTSTRLTANEMFIAFMRDGVEVPVDVRDAVYRVGIEEGDEDCWNFLYTRYTRTQDSSEARRILRALTRSFDPVLLKRILAYSLQTDKVKSQDTSRIVIYVAQNRLGKTIAWEWIQQSYDQLFERFGAQSFTLSELLARVIGLFQTQQELDEARAFFAEKDLGTAKRAVSQAYEAVQTNIFWLEERYAEFAIALEVAVTSN